MKTLNRMISLSLIVLIPAAIGIIWFLWNNGLMGDWGFESGYYGQFNRVKHVLEEMQNIQITNYWQHHDVTLEDFGFYIRVNDDQSLRIDFGENTEQMKEKDKKRIKTFIEEEIKKLLEQGRSG